MPEDPTRVTTAQVFQDLGLPLATGVQDIERAWDRQEPAYIRTEHLCPPLARLLDVRWVIGLRNPGHTVAKLLDTGDGLRVVNYTHPEYGSMLTDFLQATAANALLMRGTEGEPFADPRRTPRMDVFLAGQPRAELSVPAREGVLTQLPLLPATCDAATTAHYIQAVVSGEKPAPAPLQQQVECLLQALSQRLHPNASSHERSA
jgi:anthranilate phosphoribosyltransferase